MYHFCEPSDFLKRLEGYVNIETPSADCEQMEKLNLLLEQDLKDAGAVVTRHAASRGDVLQADIGEGEKRILLLGHKDTVFPVGTLARNPFRVETREGREILRGPGVLDMKSGVCMTLELLRHFAKQPIPGYRITALFNCDEEIGSGESEEIIRAFCKKSRFCLCMEPSVPEFCTVARKSLTAYRITAHGVAAHSGVNYLKGASAIEGLCRVVSKVYDLRDDEKDLSINIGAIEAPGKNNIVCDYAQARGELRCFDRELRQQTLDAIDGICKACSVPGVTVEFTYSGGRPAMVQDARSKELFALAEASAKEHGLVLKGRAHGGGSDGSFASDEGIPVLDGMGAEGENSHTDEEYLFWDTLYARLKTCADVMVKAAECGL